MHTNLIKKLNQLNLTFYQNQADSFDQSRTAGWRGWDKLKQLIADLYLKQGLDILDVGCGNGRFLKYLHTHLDVNGTYTGIDFSTKLLELAKKNLSGIPGFQINLEHIDLMADVKFRHINRAYNFIVVFGLLHHIPGYKTRLSLIETIMDFLQDSGFIILSFWQYQKSERIFSKRIREPELELILGEDYDNLENGDYLLRWSDSKLSRYCHSFSDEEIKAVLTEMQAKGLKIVNQYEADGKEGNLNKYVILAR